MTLYDDIYALRGSANISNRVCVALIKASQDIYDEDPATTNHANRVIWANATITTDGSAEAQRFMWAVLADTTVRTAGEAATDAQIQSAVDANIDKYATGA